MEWIAALIVLFVGGLLALVARRIERPATGLLSAPFQPLPRGPIGALPPDGMFMFGHLFQFDGTRWTSVLEPPPATEPVVQIDSSPSGTYCVTWDGIYRRGTDGWLREHRSAVRLRSLCVTPDAAYVGGARATLLCRDDDGVWTPMELPELPPCVLGPIAAADSGLYIGGDDFVLHASAGVWALENIPTEDVLMDVCTRGADVWFAAQSGEILRSKGDGQWHVEHRADHGIGAITCAPDGTLYAVGGSGKVLTSPGDGGWREVPFEGQSQLLSVRIIDGLVFVGDVAGRFHIRGPDGWDTYEGEAHCEVRDMYGSSQDFLVATSSFYTIVSRPSRLRARC